MKKLLIFTILAVLFTGCWTEKKINKFKLIYCKDSVSVQIRERLVEIPITVMDSTMLRLYMFCDSNNHVVYSRMEMYQGKYTQLQAILDNNRLTVSGKTIVHDTLRMTVTDTLRFEGARIETNNLTKGQTMWILIGKWTISVMSILILIALVLLFFKFKSGIIEFFKK